MWRRWIRPATPSTTPYGDQHRQRDDRRCGGHRRQPDAGIPGDDFNPAFSGGDTDSDGLLDVGETWTYTAAHTVTQAEIDAGAALVNVATATGTGATSDTDDATVTVAQSHGAEHREGRRCDVGGCRPATPSTTPSRWPTPATRRCRGGGDRRQPDAGHRRVTTSIRP